MSSETVVDSGSKSLEMENIETTSLGQFIQIMEISFVFLLVYTLITMFDAAIDQFDLYSPISSSYLGEENIGSLRGGQWEEIVRVTIVFNLLLFVFSLIFGLWMRKTRDGWTYSQLGFTFRTEKYGFREISERGIILGLLVIFIHYTVMTLTMWFETGSLQRAILSVHTFYTGESLYSSKQLNAEYYFGFVEMGIIWPLSAGFFFFAYTHNSLAARFSKGMANLLSSLFYVYYLLFFFMIPGKGKLSILSDPNTYSLPLIMQLVVFFVVLYISFSAFGETRSIVLPFLLNFVLNVVLTAFRASNSILYEEYTHLMLIPYIFTGSVLLLYLLFRRNMFSTLKNGLDDLMKIKIPLIQAIFFSVFFIGLSFIVPGLLELVVSNPDVHQNKIPFVAAFVYIIIIITAISVLTYEPTAVYDVILISDDGRPMSSKIELFQTDEILISGFFTAISSVSEEITSEHSEIKSVKRGDREIILEDGVLTKIIALVDRDQPSIRNAISNHHKKFEIDHRSEIQDWKGTQLLSGDELVNKIAAEEIKFSIPQQTRWVGTLTLLFGPLMIILLGLLMI